MSTADSHDKGAACVCVAEHRPKVMEFEVHHIQHLSRGGLDVADNRVWLCPTTHTNCHEAYRMIERYEGSPPAALMNTYPRYARELAWEGWRRYQESRTAA